MPVAQEVLVTIDREILRKRPEYWVYLNFIKNTTYDLSCLNYIPSVKCLQIASDSGSIDLQYLNGLSSLEQLALQIPELKSLAMLSHVPTGLKHLFIGKTKSKKLSLYDIERLGKLEKLEIDGISNGLDVITSLNLLRHLSIRSASVDSLSFIRSLKSLSSLAIRLGSIQDVTDIESLSNLQYLEIWRARNLSDLTVLSKCYSVQFIYLEDLPHVKELPSFKLLGMLRRVYLENMKGLQALATIADAPIIQDFAFVNATHLTPDDFDCIVNCKTLRRAAIGFGSAKKNAVMAQKFANANIATNGLGTFVFQ